MRFPRFSTAFITTFLTFGTFRSQARTARSSPHLVTVVNRPTLLRSSMPLPLLGALFGSSTPKRDMSSYPVQKSDDEWRAILSPGTGGPPLYYNSGLGTNILTEQFRILRQSHTERAFSGPYNSHHPSTGTYACAGCGAALYRARHKFKSGCGWPAFFDAEPGAVERREDNTLGMKRTEIVCAKCGGHLGHVFKGEGYDTPTDERHCVNSVSLSFSDGKTGDEEAEPKQDGSKV